MTAEERIRGDNFRDEELCAYTIARLLRQPLPRAARPTRHVAVGMASPIPATGAMLARDMSEPAMRVSVLGAGNANFWTNGGAELFDVAAQGRLDAFFLSGGQIDGQANINLVGVGDYPNQAVRWSGSFGSAYLYFMVPKVILFRWEHSRRTLVDRVDFISAPGTSAPHVHRPGGPVALITNLCLFDFDRAPGRFRLASLHPGHSLEEVRDNTGFDFDVPETLIETPAPPAEILARMRGPIAKELAAAYPLFAAEVFGVKAAGEGDAA